MRKFVSSMLLALGLSTVPALAETDCSRQTMAGIWLMAFGEGATCEVNLQRSGRVSARCSDYISGAKLDFRMRGRFSANAQCEVRFQLRYKAPFGGERIEGDFIGRAWGTSGSSPDAALLVRDQFTNSDGLNAPPSFAQLFKKR